MTTPPNHVLLCYFGSADNDRVLRQTAELCQQTGAQLSLVLPVVDAAVPEGCCGIQGDQWRRLMDEESRDAIKRAVRVLEDLDCTVADVAVEAGPSVPEVARRAASRCGCDAIAVSRKRWFWPGGGLSRGQLRVLQRAKTHTVFELGRTLRRGQAATPAWSDPR